MDSQLSRPLPRLSLLIVCKGSESDAPTAYILHDYMKILNTNTSTTPTAHAIVEVTDHTVS